MTPAIAPPPIYNPPTASVVTVVATAFNYVVEDGSDLVEEPMDYSPLESGRVRAPDLTDEAWAADDTGPMGF
jgi:hypothetical protein